MDSTDNNNVILCKGSIIILKDRVFGPRNESFVSELYEHQW